MIRNTPNSQNRRLALSIGPSGITARLVSADMPIGPVEAKLRARLNEVRSAGLTQVMVQWMPSVHQLTYDEKAAAIAAYLETMNIGDHKAA